MPRLNRDGVELHYEVHGQGPAILLTHGFAATSQMWRGQIGPLARNHTLILWDMRGHGESDSPEELAAYSEVATVADMRALLDAVGAEQAVVGGLSLGGYMSLAFHLRYPERVRALLIIDTGPGFKKDDAREAWNRRATGMAETLRKDGVAGLHRRSSPEMANSRHRSVSGLVMAGYGMLTQRDSSVIDSLPSVAVPTIVIAGAEDTPFLAATDYMAAKIPGARKVVVPAAGHAVNLDQPEAFNRAVEEFLEGL